MSTSNQYTVRSKLNQHFGSESNLKNGSAYKQSKDLEDPVDIYNHTKDFFKRNVVDFGDDDHDKVDIGERKIKGDINMMDNELD